jgi:hypothetical protein
MRSSASGAHHLMQGLKCLVEAGGDPSADPLRGDETSGVVPLARQHVGVAGAADQLREQLSDGELIGPEDVLGLILSVAERQHERHVEHGEGRDRRGPDDRTRQAREATHAGYAETAAGSRSGADLASWHSCSTLTRRATISPAEPAAAITATVQLICAPHLRGRQPAVSALMLPAFTSPQRAAFGGPWRSTLGPLIEPTKGEQCRVTSL